MESKMVQVKGEFIENLHMFELQVHFITAHPHEKTRVERQIQLEEISMNKTPEFLIDDKRLENRRLLSPQIARGAP